MCMKCAAVEVTITETTVYTRTFTVAELAELTGKKWDAEEFVDQICHAHTARDDWPDAIEIEMQGYGDVQGIAWNARVVRAG